MDLVLRTRKNYNNPFHQGQPDIFWGQGENDLLVDTNKDFALTQGIDCLKQSIAKITTTQRGANIFSPMYGSTLEGLIGVNYNIDYLRAQVKTDLIDTLRIYQFINKSNTNLDEQIDTLKSLSIQQLGNGLQVSLTVVTRSGQLAGSTIQVLS